ncbi:hypothetical protein GTQ40_04835 [Flavobacteriaceae bacterium R38]|nr:hypothetical protein [Flavobacteriaceae bacterium R38]
MGAFAAIIAIRNNDNMRNKRNHFSKDYLGYTSKKEKPRYNTISKSDLKKLRRKLQLEQAYIKERHIIAIATISILLVATFSIILFL